MIKKTKRENKTKDQVKMEIETAQKINHIKDLVRSIFPLIEPVDSIYDAQTVVNALSGFITAHLEAETDKIKMNQLVIDLSKEEDSKIKQAILNLVDHLKDEPAKASAQTLERLGKVLGEFSANEFMKQPMETIKITDIVAG